MIGPTSPSVFAQAERELSSFLRAVDERFGADAGARATEFWFAELEALPLAPAEGCEECFDFRLVSIAAASQLARERSARANLFSIPA